MTPDWPQIAGGAAAGVIVARFALGIADRLWQKGAADRDKLEQKAVADREKLETEFKNGVRKSLESIDSKLDEFGHRINALQSDAQHTQRDIAQRLIQVDDRHIGHVKRWEEDHRRIRVVELLLTRVGLTTKTDVSELLIPE